MKMISLIVMMVLLAGCDVGVMSKAKQDVSCQDKGGVYSYRAKHTPLVECKIGEMVRWRSALVPVGYTSNSTDIKKGDE